MAVRGAKNKAIETATASATLETVKKLDTIKVIEEINGLQVSVQDTLAKVGASITGKLQQVKEIDQAIDLKEVRLKELHGIEAQAVSLDDLKAQQAQAFDDWQKETTTREQQRELDDQETTKTREREEETWQYEFEQRKARQEATFKEACDTAMRVEKVRKETLEKGWQQREAELKAKEAQVAEAVKLGETFEDRVKKAVATEVAIVTAAQKKSYDHEKALATKDAESAKAMAEREAASLNAQIGALNKQNTDLREQLVSALRDAKDVAAKALEASSDRRVADAFRQMADGRDQSPSGKNK